VLSIEDKHGSKLSAFVGNVALLLLGGGLFATPLGAFFFIKG